jgi:S-adenosylmethionine hydrolase
MITLSSDFGSPYPAAMKGVILGRTDARLVDIAHDFPRQDIAAAAFWLREVLPYFPPAVHLVVVDPGVGTDRAAIVVRAGGHALVGPDNGVLVPAARALAAGDDTWDSPDEGDLAVFEIVEGSGERDNESEREDGSGWPPAPASSTFHGRDVFAPAAARVHEVGGGAIDDDEGFERTDDWVDLTFPTPTVHEGHAVGDVLVVDGFGNAITNVPGECVIEQFGSEIAVDGERAPARETYAAVAAGERLVTVGSHGNAELAVNRGRGADAFGVEAGDSVRLAWG